MSEEINEILQILEFTGRGMGAVLRTSGVAANAAVSAGKGAAKARKWTAVQVMQAKLRLHYADKGTHSSLRLRDIEKLTGGNYGIFKIPLERGIGKANEQDIRNFFDALKTLKIPFSELPDLNVGDGYIEIAYNPQDAGKLKDFMNGYKFPQGKRGEEISIEDYMGNATHEAEEKLAKQAVKNALEEMEKSKDALKKKRDSPDKSAGKEKSLFGNKTSKRNLESLKRDAGRMQFAHSLDVITVSRENVFHETENGYIMKVPGAEGEEPKFWTAPKKKCQMAKDDSLKVQVETVDTFEVLDKNGKKIADMDGSTMKAQQRDKQIKGSFTTREPSKATIKQVPGVVKVKPGPARTR